MRKLSLRIVLVALAMILAGAALIEAQANQPAGSRLALKVTPGPEYKVPKTILLFITFPIYPQIACWIETPDGTFVDTVYVTASGSKNKFQFAPRNGRPEALPVWHHHASQQPGSPDAVSGATSTTTAEHLAKLAAPLAPGRYVAFLEVNRSYDYNERFTRANSGVNGQPSLIYRAELLVGKDPSKAVFVPFGVGSVDGSDGTIRPGLDGITSASNIIEQAEIEYAGN